MQNVEMKKRGNKLTITIDLGAKGSPSSSGKTIVLASTRGNKSVPGTDDIKIGLNCYRKK